MPYRLSNANYVPEGKVIRVEHPGIVGPGVTWYRRNREDLCWENWQDGEVFDNLTREDVERIANRPANSFEVVDEEESPF